MSTAEQLITSTRALSGGNPGFTDEQVLGFLNDGLLETAGLVLLSALEATDTVDTVTTGNEVALPDDYHRGLFEAKDGTSSLKIYLSKAQMLRSYSDATASGSVSGVCAGSTNLMYLDIPSTATTLTLFYYRVPTVLVALAEPDAFDAKAKVYGESAIKYYAAARMWDEVEDGLEGPKVNTMKYEARFLEAIEKLEGISIGTASHPRPPVVNCQW